MRVNFLKNVGRRVFLIVLDSLGIGALPDASMYGDVGANTLLTISKSKLFNAPNLARLGYFNIEGVKGYIHPGVETPEASYARFTESSKGKDTTVGHWEIAGYVSERPLPVYPNGFPKEIIDAFEQAIGVGTLCNLPYSGTAVLQDYGEEHIKTGKPIIYTSADSVFQIAAHEEHFGLDRLYDACEKARKLLVGEHGVGRVIARPFIGNAPNFARTANRHDYSLAPLGPTMLDDIAEAGLDVIGVGKIYDIFAGKSVTRSVKTTSNADGMQKTSELANEDFNGLCFINLVDFDMVYGHRNDIDGYASALSEFDAWLGGFLPKLRDDDLLIITSDHGCDPGYRGTDHTREYIPALFYNKQTPAIDMGTGTGFSIIADAVKAFLFEPRIDVTGLITDALHARTFAYAPYSGFKVGAALLSKSGKVYLGCNVENAAYTPTSCAERTAFVKAVSEGETEFSAIAIVGGAGELPDQLCTPCGVCRQVMLEFCDPKRFQIILAKDTHEFLQKRLEQLIPHSFSPRDLINN